MELEHRVSKLEFETAHHKEEISEIKKEAKQTAASLLSIEKTLSQIKWIATGAIAIFVAQSVGLDKAVKLLLGV
jgi:hypothetical protein